MRDDDRLLDVPDPEYGTGVIGVCDICGTRQAVIVLTKERYKLCVLDFLNKTWLKSDKKPGVPAPLYRSERVHFPTDAVPGGSAPAIVLTPAKVVRHPAVLVTPDVYGITTTLLDAAIRFAREGFEVLIPDVARAGAVGPTQHLALRSGARFRGGVDTGSKRVERLVRLYSDALAFVRSREMVDPAKSAVFGTSYGASLALAVAARDTRLTAVALAYPIPVRPPDLAALVTAPIFVVAGGSDPAAARARSQLEAVRPRLKIAAEWREVPNARHDFLSRDLSSYELSRAEEGWTGTVAFLKHHLSPPPPRPPAPNPSAPGAAAVPAAPTVKPTAATPA